MAGIWTFAPLIFAVGLALLYSTRIGACILGGGLITVAMVVAWAPGDVDDWYMAIFLAGVGGCVLFAIPPRWLHMSAMARQPSASGRWKQFNLRRLLGFVAFVSVLCAVAAFRARSEKSRWYTVPMDRSWRSGEVEVRFYQNGMEQGIVVDGQWPEASKTLWIRYALMLSNGRDQDQFLLSAACPLANFQRVGAGDYSGANLPVWVKTDKYRAVFDYEIWNGKPEEGRLLKKDSVFSEPHTP